MGLIKCPRCELNYIQDTEKICSVCRREVRGEPEQDDLLEMCSECGEHPALPSQELCMYCLKELQHRSAVVANDDGIAIVPGDAAIDIDSVSTMDEIALDIPDDMADTSFQADDDEFVDDEDEDDLLSDDMDDELPEDDLDEDIDDDLDDDIDDED